MRILLVVPLSCLDFSRSAGGVDSVCQMLLKGIAEGGGEEDYRIVAFNPFDDLPGGFIKKTLSDNVQLHWYNISQNKLGALRRPIPNIIWHNRIVAKEVDDFSPNILHSHIHSWVLFKHRADRRILTLHSYQKVGRKNFGFWNNLFYERIAGPINLANANVITTVSKDIQDILKEKRLAVHIPNPVIDVFFSIKRESVPGIKIIMPGNVNRQKRIHDAVDVVGLLKAQWPMVRLRVAGRYGRNDQYFKELMRRIKNRNLEDNVNFLGSISTDEMCREYATAHAGLFMSEQETFGLAPLEMMAAGVPVVATDVGACCWYKQDLQRRGAEIIRVGNVVQAAQSIGKILEGTLESFDELRKFIAYEFRNESIIKKYISVYHGDG